MTRNRRGVLTSIGLLVVGLVAGIMIAEIGSAGAVTGQRPTPAVNTTPAPLDEVIPQGAFVRVAEQAQPALVYIQTEQTVSGTALLGEVPEFFRRFFDEDDPQPETPDDQVQTSQGSGFVISSNGYIVTNAHVVSRTDMNTVEVIAAESVTVRLANEDEYDAEIVGVDIGTDLAVLKIEASYELPFIPLGDSDQSRVGEWVMALGAPFGLTNTVSAGIISAKGRAPFRQTTGGAAYQDFIQTDAAINRGNSGGPLVNLRGEVIGINTAIVSNGFQGQFAGVGFAIPINLVSGVVDQLIEHGRVIRGWLGISMTPLPTDAAEGYGLDPRDVRGAVQISTVNDGEPAALAGVRVGDIVVGTDGLKLKDNQDFLQRIAITPPDAPITLDIIRLEPDLDSEIPGFERSDLSIEVVLGERPPEVEVLASSNPAVTRLPDARRDGAPRRSAIQRQLGLTVVDLSERVASELEYELEGGVVVARMNPTGAAARAGLAENMIIRGVHGRAVESVDEFDRLMSAFPPNQVVILDVWIPGGVGSQPRQLRIPESP